MPAREHCFWTRNRIDAFIDSELNDQDIERFERHIAECEWCRTEFEHARKVIDQLHSLPLRRCPAPVLDRAARLVEAISYEHRSEPAHAERSWLDRLFSPAFSPVMTFAAVLLIAVSVMLLIPDRSRLGDTARMANGTVVTREEAQIAEAQVALAFAYVNKYSLRMTEVSRQGDLLEGVMNSTLKTVQETIVPFPIHKQKELP